MAINTDHIWSHRWQGQRGGYYKLIFIPSSATALPGSPTENDLYGTILDVETDSGFPESLPYGMPKAPSLKFKLNLRNLSTDLKQAILQVNPSSVSIIKDGFGETKYIPNQWKLVKYTDSTYNTVERVEFWGVQNIVPTVKGKLKKGVDLAEQEIVATDIFHYTLQEITPFITGLRAANGISYLGTTEKQINYAYYDDGNSHTVIIYKWRPQRGGTQYYNYYATSANFFDYIRECIEYYLQYYTRDSSFSVTATNIPYHHWKVYELTATTSGAAGSEITDVENDTYVQALGSCREQDDDGLGLLAPGNTQGLNEYETLKDVFQHYSEGCATKFNIQYETDSSGLTYDFLRLNDRTLASSPITLLPSNIIGEMEIEYNYSGVKGTTTYYKCCGQDDINEFSYNLGKTLSQDSFEIQVIPQTTQPVVPDSFTRTDIGSHYYIEIRTNLDRNLYYFSSGLPYSVHDNIKVYTDNANYIDGSNNYDKPAFNQTEAWAPRYNKYVNSTSVESGSGYIIAKLYTTFFGNTGNALLKAKMLKTNANNHMVGDIYSFDIDNFTNDETYTLVGTSAYLVSTKINYKSEIAEVEYFVKSSNATI